MKRPEKRVFSEADFDRMTWHDATIHAIAFKPSKSEMLLDIDYLLEWIESKEERRFKFWVAPATLIFENIHSVALDFSADGLVTVDQLLRANPKSPRNRDFINKKEEWTWTVDLHRGSITFAAVGFRMFIRNDPTISHIQTLELENRGGISFLEREP